MSTGRWKKNRPAVPRPGTEDQLLQEPYPIDHEEDARIIWHRHQFYALRGKALSGEKGVVAAIQAQTRMMELDFEAGMKKPEGGEKNGHAVREGIRDLLPAGGDGRLLGAVLSKRTPTEKKEGGDE